MVQPVETANLKHFTANVRPLLALAMIWDRHDQVYVFGAICGGCGDQYAGCEHRGGE